MEPDAMPLGKGGEKEKIEHIALYAIAGFAIIFVIYYVISANAASQSAATGGSSGTSGTSSTASTDTTAADDAANLAYQQGLATIQNAQSTLNESLQAQLLGTQTTDATTLAQAQAAINEGLTSFNNQQTISTTSALDTIQEGNIATNIQNILTGEAGQAQVQQTATNNAVTSAIANFQSFIQTQAGNNGLNSGINFEKAPTAIQNIASSIFTGSIPSQPATVGGNNSLTTYLATLSPTNPTIAQAGSVTA